MNNINFDISFNTNLNTPINNIPINSDFNIDNNVRAIFRNRILNLLNLSLSGEYDSNNINNFINNSLYEPKKKYKKIISAKGKNMLSYIKFNTSLNENICPIMQLPFEEGEEIIQLPCNHCFNKEGILTWLQEESSKCPVCRYELPYDEIEIENNNISTNDISDNNINPPPLNDISLNDISNNMFQSDHVLPNLFNEILNWSNQRHNNSTEENFESLFSAHRPYNPYSIVNRSIYNREQYEEEQIQRAIMASLNVENDDLEPEDVD